MRARKKQFPVIKFTRRGLCFLSAISFLFVCVSSYSQDANSIKSRADLRFPDVGKYQVLRADFHNHTKHSDGKLTPAERIEEAWKLGYDATAITDHGKIEAYKNALPVAQSFGIVLIRALETGLGDAGKGMEHLLALGVSENYKPKDSHKWDTAPGGRQVYYQEEFKRLKKDGGILILAHPHVGFREPVEWGVKKGFIKGVELKNDVVGKGWNTKESHGTWFYPDAMKWACDRQLALLANTDAHSNRPEPPATTLLLVRERSPKGVLDAICDARTIAWFDGMLWGTEKILDNFIRASVDVSKNIDGSGKAWVHISNRTPATLKLIISGNENSPVEISGRTQISVSCGGASEPVSITWTNIGTSVDDNLKTVYN